MRWAGERGDEERADGDEKKTKAKAKAKRPKKSSERKESAEGAQRQEGALWAQSDLNHDGGLDVHEWTGLFSRIQQGRQKGASEAEPTPATAGEIEARFKALDSNGDGRLTQVRQADNYPHFSRFFSIFPRFLAVFSGFLAVKMGKTWVKTELRPLPKTVLMHSLAGLVGGGRGCARSRGAREASRS